MEGAAHPAFLPPRNLGTGTVHRGSDRARWRGPGAFAVVPRPRGEKWVEAWLSRLVTAQRSWPRPLTTREVQTRTSSERLDRPVARRAGEGVVAWPRKLLTLRTSERLTRAGSTRGREGSRRGSVGSGRSDWDGHRRGGQVGSDERTKGSVV